MGIANTIGELHGQHDYLCPNCHSNRIAPSHGPRLAGYLHRTGITEWRERSFTASEAGRYVLLLVNWDDESTEVIVDAAVWEAEE